MQGSLLEQARPGVTTAVDAFSPSIRTEVTRIMVCNTTGTAATLDLFHSSGQPYGDGNAIYRGVSIAANSTWVFAAPSVGAGIPVNRGETLGVRVGTANALTLSIYGMTTNIAPVQPRQ